MKKNIAIISGGYSSEFEISIKSGAAVYKNLNREKYRPFLIRIRKDSWVLITDQGDEFPVNRHDFSVQLPDEKISFDCIFNAIHGSPGEDGLLGAYFHLLGIPMTSCSHYVAALTFNKRDLISCLRPYGIPAAIAYFINQGDPVDVEEILARVGLPCFVKANRAGSSFGVMKVTQADQLIPALENAFKEDHQVLIEQALEGREVSVGVITYNGKITVLPITEILSENDFFDYEAKYLGKSEEVTPAQLETDIEVAIRTMAAKIYKVLELSGYSRSEFILQDGIPHLLEVNTTPGLTEASILPQQAQAAGIPLEDLFGSAIEAALTKKS